MSSSIYPKFYSQPIRYLKWAAHEKPAIFYSCIIGAAGPPIAIFAPPIRARLGDGPREQVPFTYPVPTGPRKIPQGYDD